MFKLVGAQLLFSLKLVTDSHDTEPAQWYSEVQESERECETALLFMLSRAKYQRKFSLSHSYSLSVNAPLNPQGSFEPYIATSLHAKSERMGCSPEGQYV